MNDNIVNITEAVVASGAENRIYLATIPDLYECDKYKIVYVSNDYEEISDWAGKKNEETGTVIKIMSCIVDVGLLGNMSIRDIGIDIYL